MPLAKSRRVFTIISATLMLARSSGADTYPMCGDCWCIPSSNGTGPCSVWQPQTTFPETTIAIYLQQTPEWIYTLNCNPYDDANCSTMPVQEYLEYSDDAVCAFLYPTYAQNNTASCTEYTMATYKSREDAVRAGAIVTHEGSCGLCSTTQDLALYLTEDFTEAGKRCATKGLLDEDSGLECYMALGLTLECAKIWNYDGIYDGKACGPTCVGELTAPNNGPPPECALNECLQCDEEKAGQIFSAFAGRTRRRSGLISEIIRPCESVARIFVHDPCFSENPNCSCP